MTRVEDQLRDVCKRINENGFYVGFVSDVLDAHKQDIESQVNSSSWARWLEHIMTSVNPHGLTTAIYKVNSRAFTAYPVCGVDDAKRFFASNAILDKICGIAIVSHKLKMLSFLCACYDMGDSECHLSLWSHRHFNLWMYWCGLLDDGASSQAIRPNPLHESYKCLFSCKSSNVFMTEICTSIEDHYCNELFLEKIYVENQIEDFKRSIKSAETIIENMRKKISDNEQMIDNAKASLKKYEVDLYASRVNDEIGI